MFTIFISTKIFIISSKSEKESSVRPKGNMKNNEEFDMLLNEMIPHATSVNLHYQHQNQNQNGVHGYGHLHNGNNNVNGYFHDFHLYCDSPFSRLSLPSVGGSSSSSSLSGLEETKPQTQQRNHNYFNDYRSESKLPVSLMDRNFLDMSSGYNMDLSQYLHNLTIKDDQDKFSNIRGYPNENFHFNDSSLVRSNNGYVDSNGVFEDQRIYSSDYENFNDPFIESMKIWDDDSRPTMLGFQERKQTGSTLSRSSFIFPNRSDYTSPCLDSSLGPPWEQKMEHLGYNETLRRNFRVQEDAPFVSDSISHPIERISVPLNVPNNWIPHSSSSKSTSGIQAFSGEGSWIIEGSSLNTLNNKKSYHRTEQQKLPYNENILELNSNNSGSPSRFLFLTQPTYGSLWAFEGKFYSMAKDQNGCRFLQKKFNEATLQEIQMIFYEIIDHVVELTINPFGNYFVQKLLDVCTEEQRMQIVIMVTSYTNQLVRISLNTHGTRVVQKLISTLKTREQISVVISALEPGLLYLMKDPNGNHVLLQCLKCLSSEDNKFIFNAASRFCFDIATHKHGCCVLQKCIDHSTGGRREKLLAEISVRGLYLAQDAFGNYVIQHVVKQQSPSANAVLHSQFMGRYITLSLQKFSSHVVETCLRYFKGEEQSQIVHELLSFYPFEQLVQDEYANYVILSGLRYCKGSSVNALIGAIQPHIAALKTSPYCKQIYSKVASRKRDKKL